MKEVFVVSCCRTAIGSFGGALKDMPAAEMGAIVIAEALKRGGLAPEHVEEVIFGCVLSSGLGQNVARQAAVAAGIPIETPAFTVGMVCGSGMKSVVSAAQSIISGDAEVILAGGTENMSRAPYAVPSARWGARMGASNMVDTMLTDGLIDAFNHYHMGITAENICEKWNLTREELDAFALSSQEKTAAAQMSGRFEDEIVAMNLTSRNKTVSFEIDEYPRNDTTAETLAKLKPAFKTDGGIVTAGNSSGINDGAAAILLASGEAVKTYGLKPMAKLIAWGQSGVNPQIMGIGPVTASKKALEKASLEIKDIDLIEANEAFAAQSIAVARELGFDMSRVNVNGGAIALGHPIGASGARIITTLLYEMKKRDDVRYALATLCIGGGMGIATVFEKCVEV